MNCYDCFRCLLTKQKRVKYKKKKKKKKKGEIKRKIREIFRDEIFDLRS
jgi:hypothetical protein